MIRTHRLAVLATAGILAAACADADEPDDGAVGEPDEAAADEGGFDRHEEPLSVGEPAPDPEDVGLGDEIDPWDRETLDVDLATFGQQWNATAEQIGHPDLPLDEWVVGYAMPSGDFTHEWADWLALWGSWSYDGQQLEYAAVEWWYEPEIDGELAVSTMPALAGAVLGEDDAALEVMEELGVPEIDEAALAEGIEATVVRDGVEFELYSDDMGGEFEARPAD